MKKNRLLSLALAGAMAASMTIPAFAAEGDEEAAAPANTTKITGTYEEIPINVTVPTTGAAMINPYALDIELEEDGPKITGQQIVTMPLYVTNKSEMNLGVSASVVGALKEGSTMKLSATTTKTEGNTAKSAFVYFQMKASTLADEIDLTDTDTYTEIAAWDQAYDADKDIVVGTRAVAKENIVTLKPVANDTPVVGSSAMFRLSGDCVTAPKTAWTEDDGFEVTVAFTFMPVAEESDG